MKTLCSLVAIAVAGAIVAACAPTHHEAIVSSDGRIRQRIVCRADTPGKCVKRAEEVCGEYVVEKPLHPRSGGGPRELEMTVECRITTAGVPAPSASSPTSEATPSPGPSATPSP